uniref:Uncharacterized protein n=1 Tax=Peronospora matthiolae TaxID=2874970 RepID=A0AAV1TA62_9STRA
MASPGSNSLSEDQAPPPASPTPAPSAEVSAQEDPVVASSVIPVCPESSSLVKASEAALTTPSTSPPAESAQLTSGVNSPLVVIAVRAAPSDIDSAPPNDPVGGRLPMSVPPVGVVALSRHVEACESRLAVMSSSSHYWSLRFERLEREFGDFSAPVSQLRWNPAA